MPTAMSTSTDAAPRKRAKSVTFAPPPPPQEDDTFRTGVAAILGLLVVGGVYTHFYHSATNGFFDAYKVLVEGDTFPGTNEPLNRALTGIKPVDTYISQFLPFMAALSDKGNDSSYLLWVWMVAQLGVQWAMLVMESMRGGNKDTASSYITTFGIIFQHIGLAVSVPILLLINTLKSPISKASSAYNLMKLVQIPAIDLGILPFSILFGFFFPTLAFMLPVPAINSYASRQGWIAAWQFFPVYTIGFQYVIRKFFTAVAKEPKLKLVTDEAKTVAYFWNARPVYIVSFIVCVTIHLNVMAICLLPTQVVAQFPIMGTYDVDFASVFVPPLPVPSFKISSPVEGIHIFMLWDMYVSAAAALVWATLQVKNAAPEKFGLLWILKTIGLTVVSGPIGAVVMALWERDSLIVNQLVEDATRASKDK